MGTIIVTGGAGFIGSNLTRVLIGRGNEVVVVDFDSVSTNLDGVAVTEIVEPGDFLDGLCRDPSTLDGVDTVVHQGAITSTLEDDEDLLRLNNTDYSTTLIDACVATGTPIIYASSASVYGTGPCDDGPDREQLAPLNAYAVSKARVDHYVRELGDTGSQVVGLRYFNVYGPGEHHKGPMASMVHQAARQAAEDGRIRIFGRGAGAEAGMHSRDFLSVFDVVAVIEWFLDHPTVSGVFNVGTGVGRTFLDLASIVAAAHGDTTIEYIPFPNKLVGRYQSHTRAELASLRDAGCNHRFRTLEEGIAEMLTDPRGPVRQPRRGAVSHVILDRDGVLNREPESGWVTSITQWEWETRALEGLERIAVAGPLVSVATNQSGIGRGLVTPGEVAAVHEWLSEQLGSMGLHTVGVFVCPHTPEDDCRCRKPCPGLVFDAIASSGVPAGRTVLLGDDLRDLRAARAAGVSAVLVRTGKGLSVEGSGEWDGPVVDDLVEFAERFVDIDPVDDGGLGRHANG